MKLDLTKISQSDYREMERIYKDLWWKDAKFSPLTAPEQWIIVLKELYKRKESRERPKHTD